MDGPVVIELPGIPKGKGRPRFSRALGVAYTPEPTRSYEGALKFAARQAMGDRLPLEGPLAVYMEARMPIPASWSKAKRAAALSGELLPETKPDADNLLKVLDALNQVVFVDDKQAADCRVVKVYSDRPGLRIEVEPLRSRLLRTARAAA